MYIWKLEDKHGDVLFRGFELKRQRMESIADILMKEAIIHEKEVTLTFRGLFNSYHVVNRSFKED